MTALVTVGDWSNSKLTLMSSGRTACIFGRLAFTFVDDRERRRIGPLRDEDVNGPTAVDQRVAGRDVAGVLHRRHDRGVDSGFGADSDRDGLQLLDVLTSELIGTIGIIVADPDVPEGLIVFPVVSAVITSSGDMGMRGAGRGRRGRRPCAGCRRTAAAPRRRAGWRTSAGP